MQGWGEALAAEAAPEIGIVLDASASRRGDKLEWCASAALGRGRGRGSASASKCDSVCMRGKREGLVVNGLQR